MSVLSNRLTGIFIVPFIVAIVAPEVRGEAADLYLPADTMTLFRGQAGTAGYEIFLYTQPGPDLAHTWRLSVTNATATTNGVTIILPDAALVIESDGVPLVRRYIRPNPQMYDTVNLANLLPRWNTSPGAAAHEFQIGLRRTSGAGTGGNEDVEFWVDGRFVETIAATNPAWFSTVSSPPLGTVRYEPNTPGFVVVDVERYAAPGSMSNGVLSLPVAPIIYDNVPVHPVSPSNSIDVGRAACVSGNAPNYHDYYFMRSTFDGMPESILFSVPKRHFIYAHVLAAVDTSRASHLPLMTVRVTRFANDWHGRGEAFADARVDFSDPGHVTFTPVGIVTNALAETGGWVEAILYLVEVPLDIGSIQDLLTSDQRGSWGDGNYLDVELTCVDKPVDPWGLGPNERSDRPVPYKPNAVSGVHVFGVTLEESPVALTCVYDGRVAGHVFYAAENPGIKLSIEDTTGRGGDYSLEWSFIDIEGVERPGPPPCSGVVHLGPAGQATRIIPAWPMPYGWHGVEIRMRRAGEWDRVIETFRTALVILPGAGDTRLAKQESPYGTWWFGGSHFVSTDVDAVGPYFKRAGIRHTTRAPTALVQQSDLLRYDIWPGSVRYNLVSGQSKWDAQHMAQAEWMVAMSNGIANSLAAYPTSNLALVFHETPSPYANGWRMPPEIFGSTPGGEGELPTVEEQADFLTNYWSKVSALCEHYRTTHPRMDIVFGNCTDPSGICGAFFRTSTNFLDEFGVDYIGLEQAGITLMPEKFREHTVEGSWLTRATAEAFGRTNVPLTSCFEWITRPAARVGARRQAQWCVRDCLLALAYGFKHLNPGVICDVPCSYAHAYPTIPGCGFLSREPLFVPRPSYAALATLTEVLDCATCIGSLPTDSQALYALAFDAPRRSRKICALWTPRLTMDATLSFTNDVNYLVVDLVGKRQGGVTSNGVAEISVGPSVVYVVVDHAQGSLPTGILARAQTVPWPVAQQPPDSLVANPMDRVDDWIVRADTNRWPAVAAFRNVPVLEAPQGQRACALRYLPFRTAGSASLSRVFDDDFSPTQSVRCTELTFASSGNIVDFAEEYVYLELAAPIQIQGTPASFGVWVKGLSQWAQVMIAFDEITYVARENWLSAGYIGPEYGDFCDPTGEAAVNYDGWCFLSIPLPPPLDSVLYGSWFTDASNWRVGGDIRLLGIAVCMPRKIPRFGQLRPVANRSLRFRDLSVVYRSPDDRPPPPHAAAGLLFLVR